MNSLTSTRVVAAAKAVFPDRLPAHVWIGYSGGLDSTVLLHVMSALFGPTRCTAVHVNHGLDDAADRWQHHCETFGRSIGVRVEAHRVEVAAGNVELNARLARYAVFDNVLGRAAADADNEVLVTAHHQRDVAETRLWQLLTGRAPVGIPRQRKLGFGTLLRPLIDVDPDAIRAYATENALVWIDDPSNADTDFDRNWLRHELLPLVETRFEGATRSLAELAWPELPVLPAAPLSLASVCDRSRTVPIDVRTLRGWLAAYEVFPREAQLAEINRQLADPGCSNVAVDLGRYSVREHDSALHCIEAESPSDTAAIGSIKVTAGIDHATAAGVLVWQGAPRGIRSGTALVLRSRSGGETLKVGDRHIRLSAVFQRHGVPRWERDRWPLLFAGDVLVAVPGIRIADVTDARVAGDTDDRADDFVRPGSIDRSSMLSVRARLGQAGDDDAPRYFWPDWRKPIVVE